MGTLGAGGGGGVDSRGWTPRWIPLGRGGLRQGPGGSHPRKGARLCFVSSYLARRRTPGAGWLPKIPGLSLANWRAGRSRIRSRPRRNHEINGLALAAPAERTSGLRKTKRPASLPAAGRNTSQRLLSTMARKKSSTFLAMVVFLRRLCAGTGYWGGTIRRPSAPIGGCSRTRIAGWSPDF